MLCESSGRFSLAQIASELGLKLIGDGNTIITGIASLEAATASQISFLSNAKYEDLLQTTYAAAVILKPDFEGQCKAGILLSDNPYLAFARLSAMFDDLPSVKPGVHPSAVVDPSARIAEGVSIAANVVIGSQVTIAEGCVIEANSTISDRSSLGENCRIHANVNIYHNVQLGHDVVIHSGTVIGCDGFGNVPTGQPEAYWQKIHQLGGVTIGNRVEIGSNTCIDRGALENTVISDGVIIDNLVHIAHNCIIGENTALAACVAMAGSTYIGKNCTFGGGVGIAGHISIADDVHVTGMAMITGSIKESGSYSSGTGLLPSREWRKAAVRFSQLEKMNKRLKSLEKNQQQP